MSNEQLPKFVTEFLQSAMSGEGAAPGAELYVMWGADEGEFFWIHAQGTLGRRRECDVSLRDSTVSHRHAEIRWTSRGYVLTDLLSSHGTYVNDQKVAEHVLRGGETIRLGNVILGFRLGHNTIVDRHCRSYGKGPIAVAMTKHAENHDGTPLSLVLFDLDHLKRINDYEGLLAGDAVLAHVQSLARAALRPEDTLVRFGGEEFAIVLPGMAREAAHAFAEKLRQTVEALTCSFEERTIPMTISCGVAEWAEPFDRPFALLLVADDRLYEAKKQGRNRVRS